MKSYKSLEEHKINSDEAVCIVAEIGINHNGDMGLARESIQAAAEAGADAVKFQNYHTEDFVTNRSLTFEYNSQGEKIIESQFDMFKRYELKRNQLSALKEACDTAGVMFHSTPTSIEGINDLKAVNCQLLKNGSDCLGNLKLVRAMGETGLTTILSTGMATLAEIDAAVREFRSTGNQNLILLHCTSSYPTPAIEVNLARIATLRNAFGVKVGFSDHTNGTTAAIAATTLGVRWIEKHFTMNKDLPGPDHWFSMDVSELRELVTKVREAEKMVGSSVIEPTESEIQGRKNFRLSCVASRDLEKGYRVQASDISFQRPGDGIAPAHESLLLNLRLNQSLKKGQKFKKEYFND